LKWFRTLARSGDSHDLWPVVLLLVAVLAPAIALLWFMTAAMRNERFAVQQKLAEVYRAHLSISRVRLQQYWTNSVADLENLARIGNASAAFSRCVVSGHVDSVLILDQNGQLLYPNSPSINAVEAVELNRRWTEAGQFEYSRKELLAAAKQYDALARETTNVNSAARAFQAEARTLFQAGKVDDALRVIDELLATNRYRLAVDRQGRLIAPNLELMALELITNRTAPAFLSIAKSLRARLLDYETPGLAATQRRFLMHELERISPEHGQFPTLAAEELAAQFHDRSFSIERDVALRPTPVRDVWQVATAEHGRVVALVRTATLVAQLTAAATNGLPPDTEFALLAPTADGDGAFASLPVGPLMPGWRLALSLKDQNLFNTTARQRVSIYLWSGLVVIGAVAVLTFITMRVLRRQAAVARLKNDLAATVSHELKTPLSSMRVLVDTLLDSPHLDDKTVRDYLGLIAQENERLSRVIHNFLSFSRIERKKFTFHFTQVPARQVIDGAVQAMGERFEGCRFELQVDPQLPEILADPDALTTVLVNLLDNAWKFSDDIKHIVLGAQAQNGSIVFWVKDHGIGISLHEAKNIFRRFYQVDQSLSRKGSGCGLGLSIAQYIVSAHQGRIWVESQPGAGSVFRVSLPIAMCCPVEEQKALG
jgi:signal transduction histidine kinase